MVTTLSSDGPGRLGNSALRAAPSDGGPFPNSIASVHWLLGRTSTVRSLLRPHPLENVDRIQMGCSCCVLSVWTISIVSMAVAGEESPYKAVQDHNGARTQTTAD